MSSSINAYEFVHFNLRLNLTQDTLTYEREHSLYRSDEESQSVCTPATRIYESVENVGDRTLRSNEDKWNEDPKKANNMNYEHDCFNLWKQTGKVCVNEQ